MPYITLFREKTSGKWVNLLDSAVLLTKIQFLDVFYVQSNYIFTQCAYFHLRIISLLSCRN